MCLTEVDLQVVLDDGIVQLSAILTSFACSDDQRPAVNAAVVTVHVEREYVVLDNGIVQLTLSKPGGFITGVKYHGLDNVMEVKNREDGRGFHYMAIADNRQRIMPMPDDREAGRSQKLDYSEATFVSSHYAGDDILPRVTNGEYWKKVFGPVFIYLNSDSTESDPKLLWEDAKKQAGVEEGSWPYKFPASEDFQKSEQRGSVSGRLLVVDEYVTLGYQFWVRADAKGMFFIKNVRTGVYNLYAWVPGFIGDYKSSVNITVTSDLYPDQDLMYTVGVSDYKKDWFYAHVTSIDVDSSWLLEGDNIIFLTQTRSETPFQGVMYDYIRLEAPA
ncbi:hypothetical protein GW17_00015893 [Ensete ventricosum]|nr:hypothetical protein GW17_00015893 [Ensete ventricosum]